jgi:hypothetical protein
MVGNRRVHVDLSGRYASLAKPMRERCRDLTEAIVDTGQWMAQEKPIEVNAHLVRWLATCGSDVWPFATP